MRVQVQPGKITSGEVLWMLMHELGENEEVLEKVLESQRLRIALMLHFSTVCFRVDEETVDFALEYAAKYGFESVEKHMLMSRRNHTPEEIREHIEIGKRSQKRRDEKKQLRLQAEAKAAETKTNQVELEKEE